MASLARGHVPDPKLGQAAAPVGGPHQLGAVRRPGRVIVLGVVVGQVLRRAPARDRGQVEVAQGDEGELPAVRRNGRAVDPQHLARRGRVEVAADLVVARTRHLQPGGELHRPGRRPRGGAPPHLAVGHVVEAAVFRQPRDAEREHHLASRDGLAVDLQPAGGVVADHIGELPARAPGRGLHGPLRAAQFAFLGLAQGHGVDGRDVAPGGGVGDGFAVRRPGRHAVLEGVLADLGQGSAGHVEDPDIVAVLARLAPVRGEGDPAPVRRPHRVAVVEGAGGQLLLVRAVRLDRPQVVAAVAVGEIGQGLAVRGPHRLARVVEQVGDAMHRPAAGRHDPQATLQVDRQGLAVRRDRHRHGCALVDADVDDGVAGRNLGGVRQGRGRRSGEGDSGEQGGRHGDEGAAAP